VLVEALEEKSTEELGGCENLSKEQRVETLRKVEQVQISRELVFHAQKGPMQGVQKAETV
jgi:hypothetical protein